MRFALWKIACAARGASLAKKVEKEDLMLRTTAASLLALATAILPAQAQTVLYGEPPQPPSVFPQAQPYFGDPQPIQQPLQTQPLYYESVPAVQPPPTVYQPDQDVRRFRPVAPQGTQQFAPSPSPQRVVPTRPLAPVERYRPPQPEQIFPGEEVYIPPAQPSAPVRQFRAPEPAAPPPPPMIARPEPRVAPSLDARENPSRNAPREAVRASIPDPAMPEMTESEALRDFSSELARIVELGERYRAASPGFLEDLKTLAGKYGDMPVRMDRAEEPPAAAPARQADFVGPPPPTQRRNGPFGRPGQAAPEPEMAMMQEAGVQAEAMRERDPAIALTPEPAPPAPPAPEPVELPQALPPTSAAIVYLRDDFSDGEYLSNPAWNVRQGQFTVDPAYGLRPFSPEATAPAQVTPQALLQYLIGDGKPETPEPTGDSGASLIEAQTDIGNAFSLVATITDHGGEGAAHFIMHQGGANWLGYRLELRAGPRPLVVLARRGSSGYKDIMKVEAPGFTSGKPHQLRWARLNDGQMFVLIDGRPIITARDTVFRQGWKGFAYFTADADVSMRNIRIAEPVEQ